MSLAAASPSENLTCPCCGVGYGAAPPGTLCPTDLAVLLRTSGRAGYPDDALLGTAIAGRHLLVEVIGAGGRA